MVHRLRIAQLAPPFESVPPRLYGGTERVIAWLIDQLVPMGHEVTLFASGDSRTLARLVAACDEGTRLRPDLGDPLGYQVVQLAQLAERAHEFDVVHNHADYLPFPLARQLGLPFVTTLHGRLDLPELPAVFTRYPDQPVVSISDAQRRPLPHARWAATIHHGLPETTYAPRAGGDGGYVAFLGRISPEKRPQDAIEVALRAGIPLRIAAKVADQDRAFHEAAVAPWLHHPLIDWVGEIAEHEKCDFLAPARALLFPIDWPEPFGLVMIEAMACGTPVIARPRGSVTEVIEHGVTGFLCETVDEMAEAVERAATLDRDLVRARFEARFTSRRMAADYVRVYEQLVAASAGFPEGARTRRLEALDG